MAKKILILDTGKEWGGGTNSLLELLKRMDRSRYRFTALFYNNYPLGSESDIKRELERLGVEFILLERGGARFYAKGLKEAGRALLFFSRGLKKKYVFFMEYVNRVLPDAGRIAGILKTGGYDLLYMNNQPSSNLEGILAASSLKLPCIQHSRVDVKLNPVEARTVNEWVSSVVCVSGGVRKSLVDSGVEDFRCTVVYNGIDINVKPKRDRAEVRKELGAKDGDLLIGTVGSLVKRKRVHLLIEAFARLKDINGLRCIIVGGGPESDSLKERAKRLGVDDRVLFTGFSIDALSYINAMDVFVMPSEAEGLPRVILEAMLMARPVVSFDIVGANELVVDGVTGFLVKNGPEEMAQKIRELISSMEKARAFGEAGRAKVVEGFGIDRYVQGVERVFEDVFGSNRHGRGA